MMDLTIHGWRLKLWSAHSSSCSRAAIWKTATTIPVLDGEPGQELQLDTGWGRPAHAAGEETAVSRLDLYRGALAPPLRLSHLRGNDGAREACEAAWDFFGGVFKVIIPDNTKAIIVDADPLMPRITPAFLEYAHARHFHIDPARVRSPRDAGPAPVGREGEEVGRVN